MTIFSTKISIFLSHIQKKKGSIHWVVFKKKKVRFFWVILRMRFNSLNHTQKEVQFFRVMFIKSSIHCVIFKKGSILCVIFKEKGFNSLSYIQKKVQFFELFEEFNTLSHIEKWFLKRGSILWVIKRVSFLWVIWRVQFFESYFSKRCSILWVFFPKVQSFESLLKKKQKGSILWVIFPDRITFKKMGSISMSHVEKRVQFLWVMLKKGSISMSHVEKRVQFLWVMLKKGFNFYESCWKKGSILWVVLLKGSIRWDMFFKPFFQKHSLSLFFLQKMFNSVSRIFWTRPDDRMIIPVKFQTHRINDLIHQDQTEKAKHWKKTNNSRKPHSKWTSLGFDAQQWLTQTRCWRSQWASYFTKQGQMCPFWGSPTVSPVTVFLCVSEPLSWSGSRSPAEMYFFALSHGARQQSPHNQLPTRILRQKGWGSPRLLVPTFRARRLCGQNCTSQYRIRESAVAAQQ